MSVREVLTIPHKTFSICNQKDMFRIKTALLACLLLVGGLIPVTAAVDSRSFEMSTFGSFLIDHNFFWFKNPKIKILFKQTQEVLSDFERRDIDGARDRLQQMVSYFFDISSSVLDEAIKRGMQTSEFDSLMRDLITWPRKLNKGSWGTIKAKVEKFEQLLESLSS